MEATKAALTMYGIAAVITAFVAVMIKVIYWSLKLLQKKSDPK